MSFKFGFSGDDIEEDEASDAHDVNTSNDDVDMEDFGTPTSSAVPVVEHDILEMLQSIPSQISYITSSISSSSTANPILVPRRALFDVRMQIMAESDADDVDTISNGDQVAESNGTAQKHNKIGLGDLDLEKDVYEGGFKVWEGAVDLARLLHSAHTDSNASSTSLLSNVNNVIELGAGAALPSLTLLSRHLAHLHTMNPHPPTTTSTPQADTLNPLHLTLTDYNALVLRLVTLPNLLLQYALHYSPASFDPGPPSFLPSAAAGNALAHAEGDLAVSPELLQSFAAFVSAPDAPVRIRLVSGPWSPSLSATLLDRKSNANASVKQDGIGSGNGKQDEHDDGNRDGSRRGRTLVLAAETLYSPSSTAAFARVMLDLLRGEASAEVSSATLTDAPEALALVAAKKVYFGIGGSVADFVARVERAPGAKVVDVSPLVPGLGLGSGEDGGGDGGGGGGVGRCVLKVEV